MFSFNTNGLSVYVCLFVFTRVCSCEQISSKNSHSHRIDIILPPQWYSNSDSDSNSNLSLLTLNNIPFAFRYSINELNEQTKRCVWTCCFSHGNPITIASHNDHTIGCERVQQDSRLSKLTDRPTLDEAIKFHSAPTKTLEIPCIFYTANVYMTGDYDAVRI